tara:strand:- start:71 stop:268 length:198 start_codon:yes stop_codon:yes gene_type:complete
MKLDPGDMIVEKDGNYAILLERVASLGVCAWRVYWNNGFEDLFPWVETSISHEIKEGKLKHIKGG